MGWPEVILAVVNMVQVVALALIAVWAQRTHRATNDTRAQVERINGELQAAIEHTFESSGPRV